MSDEEHAKQKDGLRRIIARLEKHNKKLIAAIEFTNKTLALCRDPAANPLEKMIDRDIAERMLREAIKPDPDSATTNEGGV